MEFSFPPVADTSLCLLRPAAPSAPSAPSPAAAADRFPSAVSGSGSTETPWASLESPEPAAGSAAPAGQQSTLQAGKDRTGREDVLELF